MVYQARQSKRLAIGRLLKSLETKWVHGVQWAHEKSLASRSGSKESHGLKG